MIQRITSLEDLRRLRLANGQEITRERLASAVRRREALPLSDGSKLRVRMTPEGLELVREVLLPTALDRIQALQGKEWEL